MGQADFDLTFCLAPGAILLETVTVDKTKEPKATPVTVKTELFPPPDPSARSDPPFHKMDDKDFEDFCCDLGAAVTPNVQAFDLFELTGAKQYGADFYLDCGPGNLIIGSCKAHEKPEKKAIIDEAVWEFVKHWTTCWREQHAVALANKNARIVWAVLAKGGTYRSAPQLQFA